MKCLTALAFLLTTMGAATAGPTCPFKYSEAFRHEVIEPIVARLGGTLDWDTADPDLLPDPARHNIRMFVWQHPEPIDGPEIQIVIDPCTLKVLESVFVPGGPIIVTGGSHQ